MSEQLKTMLPAILGLTISGLWLLYRLGIFKYLKKINDEKRILLPSLFFLTSPFIFSLAFSVTDIGNFTEIKGINSVITILTTTASIYAGNWFLDGYRKKQKQQEIARILVTSIEEHLRHFKNIKFHLTRNPLALERDKFIDKNIVFIKNNDLYNLALEEIKIFPSERIRDITRYSTGLKHLIYEVEKFLKKELNSVEFINLDKKIDSNHLDAGLCLMGLTKEIMGDEKLFNKFKDLVKSGYHTIKGIYGEDKYMGPELTDSMQNIETAFEEFSIGDELNN